jgi:hypothetical protein
MEEEEEEEENGTLELGRVLSHSCGVFWAGRWSCGWVLYLTEKREQSLRIGWTCWIWTGVEFLK